MIDDEQEETFIAQESDLFGMYPHRVAEEARRGEYSALRHPPV